MHAVDHDNQLNDVLLDENRKIPKDHLENICLVHSGVQTCRYIGLSVNGFVCVKHSLIQATLDERVKSGDMKACGDNCGGLCPPSNTQRKHLGKEIDSKEDSEKESCQEGD